MLTSRNRGLAIIVCACVTVSACATARVGSRLPAYASPQASPNRNVLVEYVQKLPPGTLVRVVRSQHGSMRGTLLKATDQSLFIQPKTRLPEPLVEVPLDDVVGVTPEPQGGNGIGRAIGAGAAAGAAASVAIFLIIIAAFD
jgi:hypothetical protein